MEPGETCWTLVRGAAAGDPGDRARFADLYLPVVRGYLAARWGGAQLISSVDDAVQEVFVECLRAEGVLERALVKAQRGFRAFLYGVSVNVARRFESNAPRNEGRDEVELHLAVDPKQDPVSQVFARGWARSLVHEAAARLTQRAQGQGDKAQRRVALLRERFGQDRPIREIAAAWDVDAAEMHHDYARARKEFREALREVIATHSGSSPAVVEEELIQVLGDLESAG